MLGVVARGIANDELATKLSLKPKTVRNHVSTIMDKLRIASRSQLIVQARHAGFGTN